MDDLSPELRLISETARASGLDRADKARLWNQLQRKLEEPERPCRPVPRLQLRWVPLAVVGALLLGFGVERSHTLLESVRSEPSTALPAHAVPAQAPRVTVPSAREGDAVLAAHTPAAQVDPSPARSVGVPDVRQPGTESRAVVRVGRGTGRVRDGARAPAEDMADDRVTAALSTPFESSVAEAGDAGTRVPPARTRMLAAAPRVAVVEGARRPPARRSASFQERLAAENLARYQAAIAQHARLAANRRSPSSIGGYAAW